MSNLVAWKILTKKKRGDILLLFRGGAYTFKARQVLKEKINVK